MSRKKSITERTINRLKEHKVVAFAIAVSTIIVGVGQLSGAFTSVMDFAKRINAPEDSRAYRFGDQVIRFEGGNGGSIDKAIVITGAMTSDAGIAAEKQWVKRFYPDYEIILQSEVASAAHKGHHFDRLDLKSRQTGYRETLYFDVTSFYGTPLSDLEKQRMMEKILLAVNEAKRNANNSKPLELIITVTGSSVTVRTRAP